MQITSQSAARTSYQAPVPGQTVGARLTPQLITDLRERQLSTEALADAALPSFLEAVHAVAGAILLYSMRTESLDLLAAHGLSEAGRKHLQTIRKGAGWPIPLHALINHKAYIIDRPRDHKFIPELVDREQVPAVANLAVIPLYHAETRVGVFLAIGGRVPIAELQIMEQVAALDALSGAIVPSRAPAAAPVLKAVPAPKPAKSAVPLAEPSQDAQETAEGQALAYRAEIDALRTAHYKELEAVRAAHEREVEELRATLEKETEAVRALPGRDISDAGTTSHQELEAARAAHAREVADLRATLQTESDATRTAHERAVAELRASHQREMETARAEHERELDAVRATVQSELESLQAARRRATAQAEASVVAAEKRIADERTESATELESLRAALGDSDGRVAERDRRLAQLADERDRAREAAVDAEKVSERLYAEIERSKADLESAKATRAAELEAARKGQAATSAEVASAHHLLETFKQDLAASKREAGDLCQRNGTLETQIARLEQQVASLTSECGALAARLAAADVDRRTEQYEKIAASTAPPGSATAEVATPSAPPVKPDPPATTVEAQSVIVLDPDPEQQERIAATLKGKHALRDRRLVVANVFGMTPERMVEVTRAMDEGVTVVGYATDAKKRSCVLGPLRLFAAPPQSAETAIALPRPVSGPRRILTLSGDVDAFREAKAELANAGHSVSMACDARQAAELFSVINPDTVVIDLRGAPEAGGQFLATLGPEAGAGRMLKVFICGDPIGGTLTRALERLLRPMTLDAVGFGQLCVDLFREPEPAPPARPFQRTAPIPRKVERRP